MEQQKGKKGEVKMSDTTYQLTDVSTGVFMTERSLGEVDMLGAAVRVAKEVTRQSRDYILALLTPDTSSVLVPANSTYDGAAALRIDIKRHGAAKRQKRGSENEAC